MGDKQFFECDCGCVVLTVLRDEWDDATTFVCLTIYGEHNARWKDKLCHIWHIIKYGHPWGSREILLRIGEADRLGRLLLGEAEGG